MRRERPQQRGRSHYQRRSIFIMTINYFEDAVSFERLYKGMKKSCRNVRWKDSVTGYEANGLLNTLALSNKLKDETYTISKYQIFTIYEPKVRTIVASRLVDRQAQRALCDAGLYRDITEHFIRDNVACQVGKGTDDALNRLKVHLRRYYTKNGPKGWVLRCDVHHFFPETRHDVAKAMINKYVSDGKAADMVCDVVDSFGGEKGIGLWSQISQLVELLVLNDMDHFIKEKLRIKHYLRYMDDFVLIHPDKEYLRWCKTQLSEYLAGIGLELNRKTSLHPLQQGIVFLQWHFKLTDTGKVLMLIAPKKSSKQRHKLRKLHEQEKSGKLPAGTTYGSYQAWMANAARGNTYLARKRMAEFYSTKIRKDDNNVSCKLQTEETP